MRTPLVFFSAIFLFTMASSRAAGDVQTELKTLVGQIQTKLDAGSPSESDLAPELKQFDAILAEHSAEKTDAVAQVLFMKAMLYVEVLQDPTKGGQLLEELKAKFPNSKQSAAVDRILAGLKKQEDSLKIQAALKVGAPFPDFAVQDLNGHPLSVSGLKGKVALIDFWATWCGPCVGELPNVLAIYQKYHDQGFDIIGISLDQDKSTLTSFLKTHRVGWPQYFDGLGWSNKLAVKYGVDSIPATYLLDKNGHILAKGLRGDELAAAVAKALGDK